MLELPTANSRCFIAGVFETLKVNFPLKSSYALL